MRDKLKLFFSRNYHMRFLFLILSIGLSVSCAQSSNYLPGYIEGEYTYISSGVDGTLENLAVERGQIIKKGDLLYQLELNPEKAMVAVSEANIKDLQAQVVYSKIELGREQDLYLKNAVSKDILDQAQSDFDSKSALLAADQAQLIQTLWALNQKTQYAPVDGEVFDTFFRLGEKVQADHPVLALLAPINIKVLFYIPEDSLSKLKLGQTITFSCDACNGNTRATVSYISPEAEYTPPVIYSRDTRYNLVYLIRASMPEDIAKNFHPGQPIEVYLQP